MNLYNPVTGQEVMDTRTEIKQFFRGLFYITTTFFLFYLVFNNPHISTKKPIGVIERKPWMVIFIHGTFNTGLGLLSVYNVFQDNIKGSAYAKITRKVRKDPFFYQEQPILQRGLVSLEPSFNQDTGEYKFAAHPILSGYKAFVEKMNPGQEELYFYTFGWNGLMSQTARLKEALRLYNALEFEQHRFRTQGINPSIRIIAHSHGGNVAMNLAAISEAGRITAFSREAAAHVESNSTYSAHEKKSLTKAVELISALPVEPPAVHTGMRGFDYQPINSSLLVDELIILGTPIQPQTSHFAHSQTFKKVYNFYSGYDTVQGRDFISSQQCSQRFESSAVNDISKKIVQAKILIDRDLAAPQTEIPYWRKVIRHLLFSPCDKEPTHKDLWLLAWNKEFSNPNFPLSPLPLVIIVPLLIAALKEAPSLHDVDLNLNFTENTLVTQIAVHDGTEVIASKTIHQSLIWEIKKKIAEWRPSGLTRENTYKKMYDFHKIQQTPS